MQDFQIESAQNVGIKHKVAGISDRFLAWLLDIVVLVGYVILASIGMGALNLPTAMDWVYALVLGLPYLMYHLLMETFAYGQSLGKMALKIRVVKLDGSKAGFSDYLLRWLLRIIDMGMSMGSVAVVTMLLNGKGQRLGDIAAKTTVISEKRQVSYRDTIYVELPENYQPKYPQVNIFSDLEIQTIKKIFRRAKLSSNHKVILALSRKTAKMMEVTPEERPVDFLEIVIRDYNYYAQR
jgi:uncharacterized RDD family membrane protein YckC